MKRLSILAFLILTSDLQSQEKPLRAGVAEVDVSPKLVEGKPVYVAGFGHNRKATAIHDPIMARAVVLEHDGKKIALVCVDVVGLFHSTAEAVRKEFPDFAYVLVSSTHNHEGPDTLGLWGSNPFVSGVDFAYMKKLEAGVGKAIKDAEAALKPVTARIGTIKAPQLLHDNRLPNCLHDDLVVIEFTRIDTKKRQGVLVQWNCHPETLDSKNTQISADFVTATVKELRKSQECPVAYFTGTVGGLMTSLKVNVPGPDGKPLADGTFEKTEEYGQLVAKQAEKALKDAVPATLAPFDIRTRAVHLPVDNKLYQLGWSIGVFKRSLFAWEGTPYPAKAEPIKEMPKRPALRTEVGYLKLGELEIAVIPGEIYPELVIGQVQDPADKAADFPDAPIEPAIYAQMKGKHKMIIGLGNDEIGYLIPKRQWDTKTPYCYGLKKEQYGEINSAGPDAAPIICEAFAELAKRKK
ncbi:MAG: hypothetical protein K8T89_08070 [Planctomycetes bacterium]|nr:hypothetical protein [Planctomycetota bacterium]